MVTEKLCKHGLNYLFRSNPRRFREKFQQLEGMGEHFKPPHWGFGAKMLSKCKKIVYSSTLFGVRYKRFVELECKQKLCGFPEKNCNRRKVLIREFYKNYLKWSVKRQISDPQIAIRGSLIQTLVNHQNKELTSHKNKEVECQRNQFRWRFTKVTPMEKNLRCQGFKRGS